MGVWGGVRGVTRAAQRARIDPRPVPCLSCLLPGTHHPQVVFNTSLAGYQEIMTDPSYKGQFVVFTCPHIGNVGINLGESGRQ